MEDTLDQFGSSEVDGPASATDYTRKEPKQDTLSIVDEGGESGCCEPEPVSSSVDEACGLLTCDPKLRETSSNQDELSILIEGGKSGCYEPEPVSSSVDEACRLLRCDTKLRETSSNRDELSVIVEAGESGCCEPEPVSSSVDEACWLLTCDTKLTETSSNWDKPEPRSSAVNAEIVQLLATEANIKGSLLPGQYIRDYDATECDAHILSENMEVPPVPENLTCDAGGEYPLKPDMKSTLQYICKSEVNEVEVFNVSLKNRDKITSSESATSLKKITCSESAKSVKKITSSESAKSVKITSSESAKSVKKITCSESAKSVKKITSSESAKSVKKGSLSETTGMEINELPVDSENTEAGVSVIDVTESEHKSSGGRNSAGGQLAKDRKLKQAIVQSLRQRQVPPAAVGAPEDGQSSSEQSSLVVYTQRPGTMHRSMPILDRQVGNLREAPHVHVLNAQRMARLGMLRYPYNASFMVMVGICLTTVFILLSRLFFILDISNIFFN